VSVIILAVPGGQEGLHYPFIKYKTEIQLKHSLNKAPEQVEQLL